jgi:hypothetical protein
LLPITRREHRKFPSEKLTPKNRLKNRQNYVINCKLDCYGMAVPLLRNKSKKTAKKLTKKDGNLEAIY